MPAHLQQLLVIPTPATGVAVTYSAMLIRVMISWSESRESMVIGTMVST